jgi:hypothetical protein
MHIHTVTKKIQGPCVKKKGSLWRDLAIGILVQYNYKPDSDNLYLCN